MAAVLFSACNSETIIIMKTINQITLSKNSSTSEIKTYFERILQLSQLDEQFPINLEEVWPLVYNHKKDAVESLKKNFIEDIDFQSLRKNPQRGAASPIIYYLSVSCLEYFIARKIRPVFDVYREVFHQSVADMKVKNISNRKSESISAESMKRNIKMMHDQLFAHLDNMGMLFSPTYQRVSAFVWDDTRSVRSNIYGFIDSYYQVVLASMRLLKEKDSDRQINEYISDKMNEIREQLMEARKNYGERLGNSQYAFSDILIGSSWSANNSIKLNIDNLFAVFSNNVVAGYYQSLKAHECERKYKNLKFEMSKLIL